MSVTFLSTKTIKNPMGEQTVHLPTIIHCYLLMHCLKDGPVAAVIMVNVVAIVANLMSKATAVRMGKLATGAGVLIISKLFVIPRLQPRWRRALTEARSHSRTDGLKAFLQIHLMHEASLLMTFNSHRGQLRFLQMPFGAKISQDVFQLQMDAILEQCPGVIGIHDDMVIFGVDQQDHDANLINLLNVCQKEGLVLNSKKLELRRERVTFFGAEYSVQGMHPDPKKVQGITEMTAPKDKQQLQSFLGMVNYMGTFIPNLSHHTEPLRAMLKKDNVFHWQDQQTRSFQQVKTLIAKANTKPLRYYDRNLPVTVQADASLRGLGACLTQQHKGKDQPIAFASKSLTDVETRYANIERELLAIIFACQCFSTYLLRRTFVAESNHKPLEMIAMKNLANAPPCLQRMLLELQRNDVTIKY